MRIKFLISVVFILLLGSLGLQNISHAQDIPYSKILGSSWNDTIGLLNCTLYRDRVSGEILAAGNTRSVCTNDYLGDIVWSHVNTSVKNNVLVAEGYVELTKPVPGDPGLSRFTINFLNINTDNTLQGRIDSPIFGSFLFDGASQIPRMNIAYDASEVKRIDISDLAKALAIQRQQTSFTRDDIWRINLNGQDSDKSLFIFQQLNKGLSALQTMQKYITGDDVNPIRDYVLQTLDRL